MPARNTQENMSIRNISQRYILLINFKLQKFNLFSLHNSSFIQVLVTHRAWLTPHRDRKRTSESIFSQASWDRWDRLDFTTHLHLCLYGSIYCHRDVVFPIVVAECSKNGSTYSVVTCHVLEPNTPSSATRVHIRIFCGVVVLLQHSANAAKEAATTSCYKLLRG